MYPYPARSQRPSSLEWLVVHTVIPSVLLTLVLQAWGATPAARTPAVTEEVGPRDPRPDPFPILLRMPRPVYPVIMLRAGIDGRVIVQALVNAQGRVERSEERRVGKECRDRVATDAVKEEIARDGDSGTLVAGNDRDGEM